MAALPNGVFPTMITPFLASGEVDFATLDANIEWYIASGCTGLFAVCQSSEMYFLTDDEKFGLAKHVHAKAAGRVKVVACGTFPGSLEEKAAFVTRMATVVDAVVVLVNQMCEVHHPDSVWRTNVQKLLDLTGDIPLGLYEVPVPYHRLLSAETLQWCGSTGRFWFHKDTCCKTKPIMDKISALQALPNSSFKFYNANIATLLFSINKGGHGFSGISANFYPQLLVWLCANPGHARAKSLTDWLTLAENVVCCKYPTSAKLFQGMFEGHTTLPKCRNGSVTFNEEELLKLESLHASCEEWCKELGLTRYNPATGEAATSTPYSMGSL